jgi:hypothetical protein
VNPTLPAALLHTRQPEITDALVEPLIPTVRRICVRTDRSTAGP